MFPCLRVRIIGNYRFPVFRRHYASQRIKGSTLLYLFQKGIVVSSTQAFLVRDVPISISVSSVTTLILLQIAFFVSNDVHAPSLPSVPGHVLSTPIQVSRLIFLLVNYPEALSLCQGFLYGFPIHFEGLHASNLLSAQQSPHVVDQKLAKELPAPRLEGPFDSPPFP